MTDIEKKLMDIDFKYDHLGGSNQLMVEFAIHNSDCTKEYRLEEMFEEMKALVLAERTTTINEVLELLVDEEENEHSGHEIDDFYCIQCGEHIGEGEQHPMETFGRNELRAELRAKLEAMREGKEL